jgi:DNA-binding transcriptional ArsR family regulator
MTNATAMLSALGDPTRQIILDKLTHGPLAVGQLADVLPISRPAVSQHLKVLKQVGLVTDRQEGTVRWPPSGTGPPPRKPENLMIETDDTIRREIVVDVPPGRAFQLFTADMTSWWPAAHHIGSAPIAEVVVEPYAGGRWFTRHEDGTETSTGVVLAWEPPGRFVVTWQIGADWKFHDDLITTVEVLFEPVGDAKTRVRLEHRDLDAFGADAAAMKKTFEDPGAWQATLRAYASVAS